jgi:hypothetical protein
VSKFVVTDVFGNTVIGSFAAWDHVTRRHPELKDKESIIEETITSPKAVYKTSDSARLMFKGAMILSGFWKDTFPVAVVEYGQRALGHLITAYLSTSEPRGNRKWP